MCHPVDTDAHDGSMVSLFMQLNDDEKQFILSKKQGRSLDSMYGHGKQRERERREPESQTASGYPMTSFREKNL